MQRGEGTVRSLEDGALTAQGSRRKIAKKRKPSLDYAFKLLFNFL